MKAETCCCYVPLINDILYNKFLLDYKFIYFIIYWNPIGDVSPEMYSFSVQER
jgi:hypothetical protein